METVSSVPLVLALVLQRCAARREQHATRPDTRHTRAQLACSTRAPCRTSCASLTSNPAIKSFAARQLPATFPTATTFLVRPVPVLMTTQDLSRGVATLQVALALPTLQRRVSALAMILAAAWTQSGSAGQQPRRVRIASGTKITTRKVSALAGTRDAKMQSGTSAAGSSESNLMPTASGLRNLRRRRQACAGALIRAALMQQLSMPRQSPGRWK